MRYYTGLHVAGQPATAAEAPRAARCAPRAGRARPRDHGEAFAAGVRQRTLLVKMPEVGNDRLAAAFARVPWEIARPTDDGGALYENNLVVRMESPVPQRRPTRRRSKATSLCACSSSSPRRPDQRPLAMRLERERLLELFFDDVMPDRRVEVDVLCHGATRTALRDKVREASGYHIVHWSGHGHGTFWSLRGKAASGTG